MSQAQQLLVLTMAEPGMAPPPAAQMPTDKWSGRLGGLLSYYYRKAA